MSFGVSVIIPYYHGAAFLPRALESVGSALRRVDCPGEVIIVDDSPHEAVVESIAAKYQVRLVRHDKNQGIAAARNTGFGAARYDVLHFLDQDDEVHEGFYVTALHQLKPGTPLVIVNALIVTSVQSFAYFRPCYGFLLRYILRGDRMIRYNINLKTIGQLVIPRAYFHPFIQTRHQGSDDTLFYLGLLYFHRKKTRFIRTPMLMYHYHGGNYSRRADFLNSLREGSAAYVECTGDQELFHRLTTSGFQSTGLVQRLAGFILRLLAVRKAP